MKEPWNSIINCILIVVYISWFLDVFHFEKKRWAKYRKKMIEDMVNVSVHEGYVLIKVEPGHKIVSYETEKDTEQ